ncbi:hypothetical protein ACQ4M3_38395 [Leptolyngbya sp. AN03gr2]|uniref:hypothetical protein n=1 Tax=unclassified Leptolyngbya TaxID=2650499 RepID=UPI003D31F4BC
MGFSSGAIDDLTLSHTLELRSLSQFVQTLSTILRSEVVGGAVASLPGGFVLMGLGLLSMF